MDTNPQTNHKTWFYHLFPPLHSWSRLRTSIHYSYQCGEHIFTPDMGKWVHFIVFGYLYFAYTNTNWSSNLKTWFLASLSTSSFMIITSNKCLLQGDHVCTPDMAKWVHFMLFGYLSLAKNNLSSYLLISRGTLGLHALQMETE